MRKTFHTTKNSHLQLRFKFLLLGLASVKFNISGNFAMNFKYHGNAVLQPIRIKDSMVVTIDSTANIGSNLMQWALKLFFFFFFLIFKIHTNNITIDSKLQ